MVSAYLNTHKKTYLHHFKVSGWKVIFQIGSDGHLGFMQITRVAQSCHLGNKAELVIGTH